ncbi:carboxypeptidase-like regulatory domain-containing protein [Deefgea rivuli]|uniref:carboxypeptidase-like regulatory domain-containing protein n=1 Tax=Deefgea rivuli TaxID=400948 RepID=UPI0004889146|nr:carboxypeptidase-like regulatory domain-containing protein [Deefgea rivuli]
MKANLWRTGCAYLTFSILAACGGGGTSTPSLSAVAPSASPSSMAVVAGLVRDTNGNPVAGVRVSTQGNVAETDANGRYQIAVAANGSTRLIAFSKTAYAQQFATQDQTLAAGATGYANATLLPITTISNFDPKIANNLTVSGSTASVQLGAGTLVRDAGAAAVGQARAEITLIDPSVDSSRMPGNYTAAAGGALQQIESFGAIQVNFSDAEGRKLNLAAGQTATLRIPAVARSGVVFPATIPLFYFNESSGRWVEEGSASLKGSGPNQYYEGTVAHFSTWNSDKVYDTTYISGCVQNAQGKPLAATAILSNGIDYTGSSTTYSDTAGKFRLAVKKSGNSSVSILNEALRRFDMAATVKIGNTELQLPTCLVLGAASPIASSTPSPSSSPNPSATPIATPSPVASYAGVYSGSYGGNEAGTWTINIANNGTITGNGHSNTYNLNFSITGSVAAGGAVSINAAGNAGASIFTGTINAGTGTITGTWRYTASPGNDGSFTGQRS